jgi:hypothetical protein
MPYERLFEKNSGYQAFNFGDDKVLMLEMSLIAGLNNIAKKYDKGRIEDYPLEKSETWKTRDEVFLRAAVKFYHQKKIRTFEELVNMEKSITHPDDWEMLTEEEKEKVTLLAKRLDREKRFLA